MSEGLVALGLLALSQVFVWYTIRIDARAGAEHREWHEHPDRIWNQGRP